MKHTLSVHGGNISRIVALLLALLLLVACDTPPPTSVPGAKAQPTMAPKPTFTPLPSATATAQQPPIATPTPPPTATPVPPTPLPTVTLVPTADPAISPLTGMRASDPALVTRRVLAVRIGNDPVIRPQDGLGMADLVYEEVMDGWTVTRFTALYLESSPERVRPVRSARLTSLAIPPQYDAALAHTGASDRIRWLLSQATFINLDEFFHPRPFAILAGYDWRGRAYTSVEALRKYLRDKRLERETPIKGYTFSATPPAGRPVNAIHIPYPASSVVDWQYDAAKGVYLRAAQGKPHLEGLTNEQISAANVIVFYAEHKATDIVEDTNGATAIDIVLTGEGRAQLLRDGVMVECRWVRSAPNELIQYYDSTGQIVPLRPGKTWIELVPTDYKVSLE